MVAQAYYVVQAFEERDGAIVAIKPVTCPGETSARALVALFAHTFVGVIAWSRIGDPDLGEWSPPEVLVRTGIIPDGYEAGGGVE